MPAIKADGVAGQQPPHDGGNRNTPGSQKQVEMIVKQRPCKTKRVTVADNTGESIHKIIPVNIT
jgi:hypothetical protein